MIEIYPIGLSEELVKLKVVIANRRAMQRSHLDATRKSPRSFTAVMASPARHTNRGHNPGAEQDDDTSETLRLRTIAGRSI